MIYVAFFVLEVILIFLLSRRVHYSLLRFLHSKVSKRSATILFSIVFLPGTFLHELAHFLTALFLLVPVRQFELLPEEIEDGKIKLGSTPLGKTDIFRRTLIGVSPLVFGVVIILAAIYYVVSQELLTTPWVVGAISFLVFEVANSMFLSSKDLEGIWVFLLASGIFLLALYLVLGRLGVEIDLSLLVFEDLIKKANLFLLVPIVLDFLFVVLFRGFKR